MQGPIPNPFNCHVAEKPVAKSIKFKLLFMAVLAANTLLTILFPNGIIPSAYAAEADYQTGLSPVFGRTVAGDTASNPEDVGVTYPSSQVDAVSALEENQD
jgi:hypothetical protein